MNLKQGTILQGGKYCIERELGQGGFGITYLTTQVGLNRKVAIKEFFMREYCNRDADTSHVSVGSEGSKELVAKFRNKFIKEAQNIAGLKHPHIISIYDVFEENGTAYYVMEYHDHGSLADIVKRQGRLSEADALRYIRQIADALRYIHERKMNHLDVKPGNILIDETDHAVLIDFGLSKRYDDEGNQTSTTPVGISHGYAPLEQYKKSGVGTFSPATDIYSLGATLYKLITGDTPPDANDILTDGLPSHPDVISPAVFAAIEQAMQPNKNNRPQSVEEFMALLEAEVDESTHFDDDSYPLRPSGSSPLKRDSAALAEEDVEDKHSKKALSPFKGDADAKGASVTTKEALASPRSPRRGSGARHNVAEEVNNEAEPTPIWKKLLLPALACLVVVLAVVLWPKGGDVPVKEEVVTQQTEILPPAGRQNDTNQQQTVQTQSQQQSQQQSQPAKPQPTPVKEEPAAPTTTPLYVTTTPSGVTVYVDGKRVGTTPIEDKEVARGSHKVKLSKEGYEDKTLTRTFGDKPVVLNETLAETPKPQPQVQPQQSSAPVASSSSSSAPATAGKINGHEYVDLGLSVKWATCNLGASSPSDYGNYYAWGETEEKSNYSRDTYKYWSDKDGDGYYDNGEYQNIGSNISGTSYDVAHVKWGGSWRMPTLNEIKELCNKCSWEWTEVNGIKGQKVTGPNGNSIFLPAAGNRHGTEVYRRGSVGDYWSGTPCEYGSLNAYYLVFDSGDHFLYYDCRYYGFSVRPVSE